MKHNGREQPLQISIAGHLAAPRSSRMIKRAVNEWLINRGLATRGYGEFSGRIARDCVGRREHKRRVKAQGAHAIETGRAHA
jgi:siroheme synthase (precorrin-2 oxidase/ferrochelatase)